METNNKLQMIDTLKNGTCPFTGNPYDCGRCEAYKTLEHPMGTATLHIAFFFGDAIRDGKRGLNYLRKVVGKDYTLHEVDEYFYALYRMGADHVPIGELCDRFCFRRGCMGHQTEKGGAK